MNQPGEGGRVVPLEGAAPADGLAYTIELWNLSRTEPERVIGRAARMVLARAIFTAAQSEHLGRRIVLRQGERIAAESG